MPARAYWVSTAHADVLSRSHSRGLSCVPPDRRQDLLRVQTAPLAGGSYAAGQSWLDYMAYVTVLVVVLRDAVDVRWEILAHHLPTPQQLLIGASDSWATQADLKPLRLG